MITDEMKKIIEENNLALATIRDNKPYVIVIGCVKVLSEDKIIITDNFMKNTPSNIKQNNNVGLVVWSGDLGYQMEGIAEYYPSGKYLDYVKKLKYNQSMPCKGSIVVKINSIKRLAG
jgi:predicted pyridoxine 5'-phosphate oxidase superfamily flavin-nucleotide-binding protein